MTALVNHPTLKGGFLLYISSATREAAKNAKRDGPGLRNPGGFAPSRLRVSRQFAPPLVPCRAGPYAPSASRMAASTSFSFSSRRLLVSASMFSRTTGSVWEGRMLNHQSG